MLPQFPAQMADMNVYGSRFAEKIGPPDPVEDELPAQYPASVPRKQQQELKFLAGKGDGFVLDAHFIALLIDHQIPKHQGIVCRLRLRSSSELCLDPCKQFALRVRLYNVVVSSRVEDIHNAQLIRV